MEKPCIQCGKLMIKRSVESLNYFQNRKKFCSKSCKAKAEGFSSEYTYEDLLDKVTKYIVSTKKYCTKKEIELELGLSSKTLVKYKILIKKVNEDLGFFPTKGNTSMFETRCFNYLKDSFGMVQRQVTFPNLLSPKGYSLLVDFYIPSLDLAIEVDGSQHTDKKNPWYNSYQKECDKLKDQYFSKITTNLLRIPYNYYKKIQNINHLIQPFILTDSSNRNQG